MRVRLQDVESITQLDLGAAFGCGHGLSLRSQTPNLCSAVIRSPSITVQVSPRDPSGSRTADILSYARRPHPILSVLRHEEPCPRDCRWHASVMHPARWRCRGSPTRSDGTSGNVVLQAQVPVLGGSVGIRGAGLPDQILAGGRRMAAKVPETGSKVANVNVDNSHSGVPAVRRDSIPTLLLIRAGERWWIGSRRVMGAARRVRPARVGPSQSLDRDGLTRCRHPHRTRLLAHVNPVPCAEESMLR